MSLKISLALPTRFLLSHFSGTDVTGRAMTSVPEKWSIENQVGNARLPQDMVRLARMLDYRGVRLERVHSTSEVSD